MLKKNFLLFCWKNIHEWPRLASHFFFTWAGAVLGRAVRRRAGAAELRRRSGGRSRSCRRRVRSRWRARSLAAIDDTEAFRRPLGGYFRDRFDAMEPRARAAARAVRFALPDLPAGARRRRLHVPDAARDWRSWPKSTWSNCWTGPTQEKDNEELREFCASRGVAGAPERAAARAWRRIEPHAVREFANGDLEWLIHRQIYTEARSTCCSSNTRRWRSIAASSGGSPARCSSTTSTSSRSAAGWAT